MDKITNAEWIAGSEIIRFEVSPNNTIIVKKCAGGYIKHQSDMWFNKHTRIDAAEMENLKKYMVKCGAI
jgi:hypothetical protein